MKLLTRLLTSRQSRCFHRVQVPYTAVHRGGLSESDQNSRRGFALESGIPTRLSRLFSVGRLNRRCPASAIAVYKGDTSAIERLRSGQGSGQGRGI
jgi:hypothetical protein